MRPDLERLRATVEGLVDAGLGTAEAYHKLGRSRRTIREGSREESVVRHEEGWAVRAGNERCSFFVARTGPPAPEGPWPEPDGYPIDLPPPVEPDPWRPPSDLDAPLLGDQEGRALADAIERTLAEEMPRARLLRVVLEEGVSRAALVSSRGVEGDTRLRLASLRVEARAEGHQVPPVVLELVEREARRFRPTAVARRIGDQLLLATKGRPRDRDRGEFLLAPPLAARLLAALRPWLVGAEAEIRWQDLGVRSGGPTGLTVVDDGRLPNGLLSAPIDAEGVPTGPRVLVEEGRFRQPLLAWWEDSSRRSRASGCSRRPSWRDLPLPGPTHLHILPRPEVGVPDLLGSIQRGYYLLAATGALRLEPPGDRFVVPVCGFAVTGGRATSPVSGSSLCGSLPGLLRMATGAARDLSFFPLRGLVGSPTILATGLELRGDPRA